MWYTGGSGYWHKHKFRVGRKFILPRGVHGREHVTPLVGNRRTNARTNGQTNGHSRCVKPPAAGA